MKRYGARVESGAVVEVFVLAEGDAGDRTLDDLGLVEVAGVRPGVGWLWDGSVFAPPPPSPMTWEQVRAERDRLLAASDWTQMPDAPLTASVKQAWADYRQTLRDIPQTQDDPDSIVWPETP